jgi:S1-C subfamily serine protease
VNLLDILILGAAASAGIGGYRLGFLARASSWLGLGLGLFIGARILPSVVHAFEGPDPSSRLIVAVVVLVGGSFLGQGLGLLIGSHIHQFVPMGPLRSVDKVAGSAVGVIGVLLAFWLILPAMGDVSGWPAEQARSSRVARALDSVTPAPPDSLQALRGLLGDGNFPRVFDSLRPAPDTGPPPESSGLDPAVEEAVKKSTLKIEGEACGRLQEGSGFAAAENTVVTNAHVVAGVKSKDLQVVRATDGKRLKASVVVFDSDRDLAVLRVESLSISPLAIGAANEGDNGAVFGHPGGQDPIRVAPARITDNIRAVGRDLYDSHKTERDVFVLASNLRPGDSGGALTNQGGVVVGVAFAIAPDRQGTAYALTTKELNSVLALPRNQQVSTGPCLKG